MPRPQASLLMTILAFCTDWRARSPQPTSIAPDRAKRPRSRVRALTLRWITGASNAHYRCSLHCARRRRHRHHIVVRDRKRRDRQKRREAPLLGPGSGVRRCKSRGVAQSKTGDGHLRDVYATGRLPALARRMGKCPMRGTRWRRTPRDALAGAVRMIGLRAESFATDEVLPSGATVADEVAWHSMSDEAAKRLA